MEDTKCAFFCPRLGNKKLLPLQPKSKNKLVALLLSTLRKGTSME